MQTLEKTAAEVLPFNMDFSGALPKNDSIASITSITSTNLGFVDNSSSITIDSETTNNGNLAQFRISGGTYQEEYEIIATVVSAGGYTIIGKGKLRIIK